MAKALRDYARLYGRKKKLYQRLYDFTFNACGVCVESGCACKDRICQHVEEQALKLGFRFEHTGHPLRFIGSKGCIIPPYLRETCTIYLCGPAQKRPGFNQDYYNRLKDLCSRIDFKLMEIEDQTSLDCKFAVQTGK